MTDENLQRNKFWLALNARDRQSLFQRIEQNSLIVCVPIAASMPSHVVFDKYYLESHVFEASTFFEGEYMSVNKKTVTMEKQRITTKRGYPEKRSVTVLAEESFYSSEPEPFRVIFLDSPLEGPAKTVCMPIDLPETRAFDDILGFLNGFDENKLVLRKMQREIDEFNQSYLLVKGFEDCAVKKVRTICEKTLEQLVCANPDFRKLYNGTDRQLASLSGVVDSYCLGKLHAKLFSGLRGIHKDADVYALRRLQQLSNLEPGLLGVNIEPCPSFDEAVSLLRDLDVRVSPLSKLELLCDVQQVITQTLQTSSSAKTFSTDDLLPIFVLVTVRAELAYLSTTVSYISLFGMSETMPPHLSYQLTTIHAIYEYIVGDHVSGLLPSTLPPLTLPAEQVAAEASLNNTPVKASNRARASKIEQGTASRAELATAVPSGDNDGDNKAKSPATQVNTAIAPDVIEMDDDQSGLGDFLSSLQEGSSQRKQQSFT